MRRGVKNKIHGNCIITMSSWKQFGGVNHFERSGHIDAYSIAVNKLTLKEVYQGNFDICGQLMVYGGAHITDGLVVDGSADISGNVGIGEIGSYLNVYADSIFDGKVQLNSDFNVLGNIITQKNVIAKKNVIVGQALDLSGGNGSFFYKRVYFRFYDSICFFVIVGTWAKILIIFL